MCVRHIKFITQFANVKRGEIRMVRQKYSVTDLKHHDRYLVQLERERTFTCTIPLTSHFDAETMVRRGIGIIVGYLHKLLL